jgi:putative ABC transport system permease protein
MLRLTVKGLWAHKLRYALTGLAIVLGVAFMAGTMVLTDTTQKTFDGIFVTANEGTDVIVRRDDSVKADVSVARDRVDAGVVERVAAVDGVRSAHGAIEEVVQLVKADGTVTKTEGLDVAVGTNWIDDAALNPFTLASGHAPHGADEVVVDKRTADREHWALGAPVAVLTKAGPATVTVVGTARYGKADGRPGASTLAADDATAQRLFAQPGKYDTVLVAAAPGMTAETLETRLSTTVAAAGSGLEAVPAAQGTADEQASLHQQLAFIDQFLMAFAFVALFVGMFIVYNTFSIVVAQRGRDLAVLRSLGARRGQVLRSVVLESAIVGVVCAAIGIAAGVGLSFAMRALISASGLDLPSGPMVVSGATIATAFVVGVAVTLVSAFVPAVRASRIPPMAALRTMTVERRRPSVARIIAGMLLTGAGVAAFAAGVATSGGRALSLLGAGALATILGVCILAPAIVGPAVRLLGLVVAPFGVVSRYARENVRRNPTRTSATASALMVGIALIGFITVFASSTKASVAAFVDRSFRADYVADSGSQTQGFSTAIEDQIRSLPGLALMSAERVAPADVAGAGAAVIGLDTTTIARLYDLGVSSGTIESVRGDGVAVAKSKATADGLHVGDSVSFRFADGQQLPMTVRAVFDGTSVGGDADWIVGLDTFQAHVADQFDRRVFISFAAGTPSATSRTALESALRSWPNASVQDGAEFRANITARIDALLNLVYGLLALALLIAVIGIANTLALSVHERRRELGLLRAIGMQRRQVRRAVRRESVLTAILGTTLGLTLGIAGAWGIVKALADQGITQFVVPIGPLAIVTILAAVAAVLAAAAPARRAAKLDVLDAIGSE